MDQFKQVTIIGTGLLGASLALALRARGFTGRIVGVGRREATLAEARGLGCFDGVTTSTAEALAEARGLDDQRFHLAVLAAPLGHFDEIFAKLAPCDDAKLIMTDVGSTKASVCAQANERLPDPTRFVGAHPMAGSEQTGPGAAVADLFEGKPCVLTPGGSAKPQAVEVVEGLWRGVGMRVLRMSPDEHDRAVAQVSHLPHAVAALLVNLAGKGAMGVASTGFGDTTRIAAGDPGLWVDIFESNRPAVVGSVDGIIEALQQFKQTLEAGDSAGLHKLLEEAKQARDKFGGCE